MSKVGTIERNTEPTVKFRNMQVMSNLHDTSLDHQIQNLIVNVLETKFISLAKNKQTLLSFDVYSDKVIAHHYLNG